MTTFQLPYHITIIISSSSSHVSHIRQARIHFTLHGAIVQCAFRASQHSGKPAAV